MANITSIVVGGAHSDERGGIAGGQQGDQTGGEVSYHEYTERSLIAAFPGMYVYRPRSASGAATMASLMVAACDNNNIGYSQTTRQGIFQYGHNSTIPIACDCSSLVSYCITRAGVANINGGTAALLSQIPNSGAFYDPFPITTVSFANNPLYNGDVLLRNGHTEMVCSGNPREGTADEAVVMGQGGVPGSQIGTGLGSGTFAIATNGTSSLVNYVNRLSSGIVSGRSGRITRISIYTAKTLGDIHVLSLFINSIDKNYNYGIDNAGTVGLFADECMWTMSSDNAELDMTCASIILMNTSLEPDYAIDERTFSSLINLCQDICRRNFIFELTPDAIIANDVGPDVEGRIPELIDKVNEYLNSQVGVNFAQVNSLLANNETEALKVQSSISMNTLHPFVVMLDHDITGINYFALRELGVIAVMLDAGQRFDEHHNKVDYRYDKVYDQTLEAIGAHMAHSYIYTTRARSIPELREEAYWFHFVVTKYPPKLGVWLRCQFDDEIDDETAADYVDEWYEFFVDWGLKSKCGLRCTRDQAQKIGWPAQCNYMPLWLEGEGDEVIDPRNEVLTPSFFKLDVMSNYGYNFSQSSSIGVLTAERYNTVVGQGADLTYDSAQTAPRTLADGSRVVPIPQVPRYTGMKRFEDYTAIGRSSLDPNHTSWQYRLNYGSFASTDSKGFRKVDNRFLIAVAYGVSGPIDAKHAGTYMDLHLANGTVIECIQGDSKGGGKYGNKEVQSVSGNESQVFTTIGQQWDCCEFLIDPSYLPMHPSGDASNAYPGWNSPVVEIVVHNKSWF